MDPSLCVNGCGFCGSAANNNLCPKCFNDFLKENVTKSHDEGLKSETKNLKGEIIVHDLSSSHKPCVFKKFNFAFGAAIDDVAANPIESDKNKKKRCKSCNKKVGLTGFECRCGDVFCGRHRYPELHACEVNFKEIGRQTLAKRNPVCIADKLENRI